MILEFLFGLLACFTLFKIIRRNYSSPSFAGQNVWVTGASSGIGEYLAYAFSKSGASLIISARNKKELERVRHSCAHPDKVQVVELDMCDFAAIEKVTQRVIEELEAKNEKLDIVVENAGVSMRCRFRDYHFDNHKSLFDINVHGPFRHIQCFVEHIAKNKSGHIVGVTSVAGKLASTHRSSYAGSKHAFVAILDSLRAELRDDGISVTNILPGYVHTNLSKNALSGKPGEKLGFTDKNLASGLSP